MSTAATTATPIPDDLEEEDSDLVPKVALCTDAIPQSIQENIVKTLFKFKGKIVTDYKEGAEEAIAAWLQAPGNGVYLETFIEFYNDDTGGFVVKLKKETPVAWLRRNHTNNVRVGIEFAILAAICDQAHERMLKDRALA